MTIMFLKQKNLRVITRNIFLFKNIFGDLWWARNYIDRWVRLLGAWFPISV